MADEYSFSYSHQPAPAAPANDPGLAAFAGCDMVTLDDNATLLLNRDSGKQLTISTEVATALTYCGTFRTLQEHAAHLAAVIPQLQGQTQDILQVLGTVRDAGLLLRAETVCERLAGTRAPLSPGPTRVCILTCDRPAALGRLLESMLEAGNLTRHQRLFLVDDSRDPANATRNRELVASFNRTSPRDLHYVGDTAQRALLAGLEAADPANTALRFLLDRDRWKSMATYGLARSVCLLLTAGYRCIVLDDDVLCRCVQPPFRREGVSFGGAINRELTCFPSEQALMQAAVWETGDPLSGHADYLGLTLGEALERLPGGQLTAAMLQGANAAMVDTLRAEAPLLLTQCGSWGDPGSSGSDWLITLDADSLRRILAAPGGLDSARANRYYWLGRPCPNFGKMGVMSQVTGMDNTRLLPPYFPVLRGEDYLFAAMLLYLHPDSMVLDLPWSVPHLPLEQRGQTGALRPAVPRGGTGLLARHLADRLDYRPGATTATRQTRLVATLRELAESHPASLLSLFRTELARERAEWLQLLARRLQEAPALGSPQWEAYLQQALAMTTSTLQSPADPAEIPDLPAGLDQATAVARGRELMGEFAAAVEAWPGARACAAKLCEEMLTAGEFSA